MKLHKDVKEIVGEDKEPPKEGDKSVYNTNVFFGSTEALLQMIEENNKKSRIIEGSKVETDT